MSAAPKMDDTVEDLIDPKLRDGISCIDVSATMAATSDLGRSIGVGNGIEPLDLLALALDKGYLHVVQSDSKDFNIELNSAALMLKNPASIVDFPISTILSPAAVGEEEERNLRLLSQNFSHARDKHNILDQVTNLLSEYTKSTSLIADIVTISDELVTNAIFNAPYVDKLNSSSGLPRENQNAEMQGREGQFFLGTDKERVVVGCRDPYGSLNVTNLLKRVRRCYETSVADNMNMTGTGGAGIGSYMVFHASSSYFVVVNEDRITLVCSVLPLKGSSRSRQEASKHLHYIYLKKG